MEFFHPTVSVTHLFFHLFSLVADMIYNTIINLYILFQLGHLSSPWTNINVSPSKRKKTENWDFLWFSKSPLSGHIPPSNSLRLPDLELHFGWPPSCPSTSFACLAICNFMHTTPFPKVLLPSPSPDQNQTTSVTQIAASLWSVHSAGVNLTRSMGTFKEAICIEGSRWRDSQ